MSASPVSDVPPLRNGDRLTAEKFERIWDLHPEIQRAELIDGLVFLDVTVSPEHGEPHADLQTWLGTYRARHPEFQVCDNTTVRLQDGVELQPDLLPRLRSGGRSVQRRDAIEGPPEMVAAIAASSAAIDLHRKRELHERNGVLEYLVWVQDRPRVAWFALDDARYVELLPDGDGVVESPNFPGLRLNVPALLSGDLAAVLAGLR